MGLSYKATKDGFPMDGVLVCVVRLHGVEFMDE